MGLARYKIYSDGSHLIASYRVGHRKSKPRRKFDERDELFDRLYQEHFKFGRNNDSLFRRIYVPFAKKCGDTLESIEFVLNKIKSKYQNYRERRTRFERKAYLNNWNYFGTVTYSDELRTERSFYKGLKRTFSNFAFRRGWRYMGVFERGKETDRLHFHVLLYVPPGRMVGKLKRKRDYSLNDGRMQWTTENSFFLERFGRNDFDEIDTAALKGGRAMSYLLKYVGKTDNGVFYSRGIADCFEADHDADIDFAVNYIDRMITKCVLFDDIYVLTDDNFSRVPDDVFDIDGRRTRSRLILDLPFLS
jgi:hypothetical protein